MPSQINWVLDMLSLRWLVNIQVSRTPKALLITKTAVVIMLICQEASDLTFRDVNPCPCPCPYGLLKDFFQVLVLVLVLGGQVLVLVLGGSGPGGPCPCPGPWGQVLVLILVLVV